MADLMQVFMRLHDHAVLGSLSTYQLLAFFRLASCLKDDVLLAQPSRAPPTEPPRALPLSVVVFLAEATAIESRHIELLWRETRFILWSLPSADQAALEDEQAFVTYGLPKGISAYLYYYHLFVLISCYENSPPYHVPTKQVLHKPRLPQNLEAIDECSAA